MLRQPLVQAARRRLLATAAPQPPVPPAPRPEGAAQVVQLAPAAKPQQG